MTLAFQYGLPKAAVTFHRLYHGAYSRAPLGGAAGVARDLVGVIGCRMHYTDIVASGYMAKNDFNCAETMLGAANEAFELGLDERALKVACPFGGGMGVERACGALTGALMALGVRFAVDRIHRDPRMTAIRDEFVTAFTERFGSTECAFIRERFEDPENGCLAIVTGAAEILDRIAANHAQAVVEK
jgi:C_GCAxxG_C_C family probable redox protein